MAFRFLGLVDQEDRPLEILHSLVSEKEKRPENLSGPVLASYADVLDHDLTKMTPKMLDDEMEHYQVSGDTKRKAVTFFLRAAKFAEIPMHPLLSAMVRNTGPRKRKNTKRSPGMPGVNGGGGGDTPKRQPNVAHLSSGGTVTLIISADPFTLGAEDRQVVFELIDKLRAYSEAHPFDEEDSDEGEGEE